MTVDDVRVEIYRSFASLGRAPTALEIAVEIGRPIREVENALRQLDADDVIALVPGTDLIWLAHPYSALSSAFRVESDGRIWDAICIWDALGILALIGADGSVRTLCPDCGESVQVHVRGGDIAGPEDSIVHFGVPARDWYVDLAHT
jgi:hypothetical protein